MYKEQHSGPTTQTRGHRKGDHGRSAGLAHGLLAVTLLTLTLPAAALAAVPSSLPANVVTGQESCAGRMAALVRFYTDRHERAANAGSAHYAAMALYLRKVLFAEEFGGFSDPERCAAVTRFLSDRQERIANADCSQYCALANSLREPLGAHFSVEDPSGLAWNTHEDERP